MHQFLFQEKKWIFDKGMKQLKKDFDFYQISKWKIKYVLEVMKYKINKKWLVKKFDPVVIWRE